MERQLIITEYKGSLLTALYEEDCMQMINIDSIQSTCCVGDIYIGKVKNIVPNIKAAFVEFASGQMGYYPLTENEQHLFLNTKKNAKLNAGDEILVQISKDNVKTKEYSLTGQISFTGQCLILYTCRDDIRISSRIRDEEKREHLRKLLEENAPGFGWMIRTEAMYADDDRIISEAEKLMVDCKEIMSTARCRTPFTKMKAGDPLYMQQIKKYASDYHFKVTTDLKEVYDTVSLYKSSNDIGSHFSLVYYDDSYSLLKLKNIEAQIDKLKEKRVWLKSGGYLIIEPTEALTVIDVNTGKAIGKNDMEANFLKVNLEAAAETARQLRLRNISGMVIIDFINMKEKAHNQELMAALKKAVNRDPVLTTVVDRTPLGLVEVTRKKERRSFAEQIRDI